MTDNADNLDAMLGGWAASVRLSDTEADTIRQAVVAVPVPAAVPPVTTSLSPSWWTDFSMQISAVMVDAGRAGAAPFAA
ncbi:MAG: hypothetical protein GEV10_19885 [Streptosporangiales bacterium]|nr:hypothetical protein [Streptosporangiales bacterium]